LLTIQLTPSMETGRHDLGPAGLDQTFGFGLIDCDRATQ
jgi:hypothetical protein